MRKGCANCMYEILDVLDEPCLSCKDYSAWEPKKQKEDNMENENTAVKIDTEAELRELRAKLQELDRKVKEQEIAIRELERMNVQKEGEIRGLKFAIRCNGVSGGEV